MSTKLKQIYTCVD